MDVLAGDDTHRNRLQPREFLEPRKYERQHTGELPYICNMCDCAYEDEESLKLHQDRHKEKLALDKSLITTRFVCVICEKTFRTTVQLKMHKLIHYRHSYQCIKCLSMFQKKHRLIKHISQKHGQKCSSSNSKSIARLPEMVRHGNQPQITGSEIENKTLFDCTKCFEVFSAFHLLKEHLDTHELIGDIIIDNKNRKHVCHFCGQSFYLLLKLKYHLKYHTNLLNVEECQIAFNEAKEKFERGESLASLATSSFNSRCPVCSQHCSDLKVHMKTHAKSRPYSCSNCLWRFKTKNTLLNHLVTQHNQGVSSLNIDTFKQLDGEENSNNKSAYRCHKCFCSFNNKMSLSIHLEVHEHIGNIVIDRFNKCFICHFCEKHFFKFDIFSSHIGRHKADKTEFQCQDIFEAAKQKFKSIIFTSQKQCAYPIRAKVTRENTPENSNVSRLFDSRNIQNSENQNISDNYENRTKCSKCFWISREKRHLLNHLKTHRQLGDIIVDNVNKRYICHFCEYRFCQLRGFRNHLTAHKVGKSKDECRTIFKAANQKFKSLIVTPFSQHKSIALVDKYERYGNDKQLAPNSQGQYKTDVHTEKIKCPKCFWHFNRKSCLKSHLATHERIGDIIIDNIHKFYVCHFCFLHCSKFRSFVNHLKVHKSDKSEHERKKRFEGAMQKYESRKNMYHVKSLNNVDCLACPICSENCELGQLKTHINTHRNTRGLKCLHCMLSFNDLHAFYKHLNFHYTDIVRIIDSAESKYHDPMLADENVLERTDENRVLRCKLCDTCFEDVSSLNRHIMLAHNGVNHNQKCHICHFSCNNFQELLIHIKQHTNSPTKKRLENKDVGDNFSSENSLDSDTLKCESKIDVTQRTELNVEYSCDKCVYVCKTFNHLRRHKLQHNNKQYTCKVCSRTFTSCQALSGHGNSHNLKSVRSYLPSTNKHSFKPTKVMLQNTRRLSAKMRKCKICNLKVSDSMVSLRDHLVNHSDHKTWKHSHCVLCKTTFSHNNEFTDHMISEHYDGTLISERRGKKICKICRRHISNHNLYLHKHLRMHSKLYACEICGISFRDNCDWKMHRDLLHRGSNIADTPCTICCQMISYGSMNMHLLSHREPKVARRTCVICNFVSTDYAQLMEHVLTYYDDFTPVKRKFACKKCFKVFYKEQLLRTHADSCHGINSSTEPISTKENDDSNLSNVNKFEKSLYCLTCKRVFNRNSSFRLHMRGHTHIKPHKCNYCDLRFAYISNAVTHVTKFHNISDRKIARSQISDFHETSKLRYKCLKCKRSFKLERALNEHFVTCLYRCEKKI